MFRKRMMLAGIVALALALVSLAFAIPSLRERLYWRMDRIWTYARGLAAPVQQMPTAVGQASLPPPRYQVTRRPPPTLNPETLAPAGDPALSPTPSPTPQPTLTPTPLPGSAVLPAPAWEKQDINGCGPASLTMFLRFWGWEGSQEDIAAEVKPYRKDRNVNVEELAYFVRTQAGWLTFEYRLGGDVQLLKTFLAAGLPVMVEEGVLLDESYWPNDDHWSAHYLLLTAYDDAAGIFTGQDSFFGADRQVTYADLDQNWQAFNRVIILVYPPDRQATVQAILGGEWDVDANRQAALEEARQETEVDAKNAFAWFNLGTNLVYFERYGEAAQAYDEAIALGLPQRMLRYQFGPFIAYFHGGRSEDLMALVAYALQRTPTSEEALLWQGWGLYRQGDYAAALQSFYAAREQNPTYQDAQYAIDFMSQKP